MNTLSVDPDLYVWGALLLLFAAWLFAFWVRRRWRFSLRSLLVVTTVVAVVLGAVMWFRR